MADFPIDPPLLVKDTPKPRRLRSISQALAFVEESMRVGRPPPWRQIQRRLAAVSSEDDAIEVAGALRELLDLEDMLEPPELPLEPSARARH
jgi:hypothetical protein